MSSSSTISLSSMSMPTSTMSTILTSAMSSSSMMSLAPSMSSPGMNGTASAAATIFEVVTAFETFCPEPTSFVRNDQTFIVVEPTTITFECPCTLTHVVPGPTVAPAPGAPVPGAPAPGAPVPGAPIPGPAPNVPGELPNQAPPDTTGPQAPVFTAGAVTTASLPVLVTLLVAVVGAFVSI